MFGASERRDFSAVSIGISGDDYQNSKGRRRQSLWRTWKRLSRLQRSMLALMLVLGALSFVYIIPVIYHDFGKLDKSNQGDRMQTLEKDDVIDQKILSAIKEEKQQKLEELKEKARKQLQSIMAKVNSKNKSDNRAGDSPLKFTPGAEQPVDPPHKQVVLQMPLPEEDMKKGADEQMAPPVDEHATMKSIQQNALSTFDFFSASRQQTERQRAVISAFQHAWGAYKKYAWGHDELHPISKTHTEWFGVGLTLVDSLDTMVIMGLENEYKEARQWVADSLTFNIDKDVNLFEITIRILGSLLSTYHLTGDKLFKNKALDLGERLLPCFNTQSKVPFSDVNLQSGKAHAPRWGPDSSTSEVTTIQLEFRDLTRVTGDPKFNDVAHAVSMHVHSLPKDQGLVPIFINAQSGSFRPSSTITLGARGDSYYEYLLKQWVQSGKTLDVFKDDYVQAVKGIQNKLIRQSEPNKLTFIGELLSGRTFSPKMDHLVCFMPGTLALGYHNGLGADHLELARQLTRTCYEMYRAMPTKLSPEIVYFNLAPGARDDLIVKPLDAHNLLRPETIESLFYMWRLTGDRTYQDWGWQIFQAFEKYTKVPDGGYSSINNVKQLGGSGWRDKMESFFLSETLKYFYLLFSNDPNLISLDKYVFNSEGHPLPIQQH